MSGTDGPYKPRHKGFDAAATRRAQRTAERAQETRGAKGEDANREYVDEGPDEYRRRTGAEPPDVDAAAKRGRPRG